MPVILLYWFAAQQKNNTLRRQITACLTQNLVLNQKDLFLASIRNMKQLRKIKKSTIGKTQIYVFRCLMVKKVALKDFYKLVLTILQNSQQSLFNKVVDLIACNFMSMPKLCQFECQKQNKIHLPLKNRRAVLVFFI